MLILDVFLQISDEFPAALSLFQVPIIPVVFSSYNNFYRRKEKQFISGTCLYFPGFPSFFFVVRRVTLCASAGTIRLKILPKIETKGMTSDDVTSLADKSYQVMRSAFMEISDSIAQSNGPTRHWGLVPPPPRFLPPRLSRPPSQENGAIHLLVKLTPGAVGLNSTAQPVLTLRGALHAAGGVTDRQSNGVGVCCSCMPLGVAPSSPLLSLGFGKPGAVYGPF